MSDTRLLSDINQFLADTGMKPSTFGRRVGNHRLMERLKAGSRLWPESEAKVRAVMLVERQKLAS